jgi:hypothetical protein
MNSLNDYIKESIFDIESNVKKADNHLYLKTLEDILRRGMNSPKYNTDMFGRELKVGDICFAYVTSEFHFIEIKEIVDDGGYPQIIPTIDYAYLDGRGLIDPSCCILIPEKYRNNFVKMIKSK